MNLDRLQAGNGVLSAQTIGDDPAIFGPPFQAAASRFPALRVRMRLTSEEDRAFKDTGQVFWRTRSLPESEATSVRFTAQGDGEWHEYNLAVADNPRWRGIITRLRLDPCTRRGVNVDISEIRLVEEISRP